jgi:hypothetical protein
MQAEPAAIYSTKVGTLAEREDKDAQLFVRKELMAMLMITKQHCIFLKNIAKISKDLLT